MDLDLSTVLLQWAAGGLLGLWVTDRHRLVGVGYGWLLRGVFAALALAGVLVGLDSSGAAAQVRSIAGLLTVVVSLLAVVISVRWRKTPARIPPGLDFLAALTGFVAVFAAAGVLGGPVVLTVARLGVGAIFLGFITDAMLLGHWYLRRFVGGRISRAKRTLLFGRHGGYGVAIPSHSYRLWHRCISPGTTGGLN
ncbi:MAG: hypothetical protein NTU68_02315 [Actinobacteria bacterium]|nr:hypothetical protein [Actinomycetota bacterium]